MHNYVARRFTMIILAAAVAIAAIAQSCRKRLVVLDRTFCCQESDACADSAIAAAVVRK
jgi:hypothetical protein